MARSVSPVCAATRARISSANGPLTTSFSAGRAAIACSARASAAGLSPRPMLVSARTLMSSAFCGCSLSNGSSSLRVCCQVCWAAAWSPATRCAQPNQKRSSPLKKPNAGSVLASISFSRATIGAGCAPRRPGKFVFPTRRSRGRSDAAEPEEKQPGADRPRLARYWP